MKFRFFIIVILGLLLWGRSFLVVAQDRPNEDSSEPTITPVSTISADLTPQAPTSPPNDRSPLPSGPRPSGTAPQDYRTIVGFRAPQSILDKDDPTKKDLRCADFSLNENIQATPNGKIGPGCTFSVDVRATGEWVITGGNFDSPPYVWGDWPDIYNVFGNNLFVIVNGGGSAFQCQLPTYTFNQSALPSYVKLEKEEDIPSNSPILAPAKRYTFSLNDATPAGQSFTIPFSFSSACGMYWASNWNERENYRLTPIEVGYVGQCTKAPIVEINPRRAELNFPVTVNDTCIPPTAVPPSPTPTKVIVACNNPCTSADQCPLDCPQCTVGSGGTAVCKQLCDQPCTSADQCPLNCSQCTVGADGKSTCKARPPAKCQCDGLDVVSGKLEKGQEVTFAVYVKVDPNDPPGNDAEGRSVVFRLEKKVGDRWTEVTNSGVIPFATPTITQSGGARRYSATWKVKIPEGEAGISGYRVIAKDNDIVCGFRTTTTPSPTPRANSVETPAGETFLGRVVNLFARLLGVKTLPPTTNNTLPSGFTPTDITQVIVPTDERTIQLGTFSPDDQLTPTPRIVKSCKQIEFEVY